MNCTVVGLGLDVIGFVIVFIFGGFSLGARRLALGGHRERPALKWSGAVLVILGFVFQIIGAYGR